MTTSTTLSPLEIVAAAQKNVSFENTEIAFASRSDAELRKMYFLFWSMNQSSLVSFGTKFLQFAFKINLPLVEWAVRKTLFSHFCGGRSIEDCEPSIKKMAQAGIGTILDYSVEGEKSPAGFEKTKEEIIRTIERAKGESKAIPFCVFKVTGVGFSDLLTKIQQQQPLDAKEEQAWQNLQRRVDEICRAAYENKVRIFIDGEETWMQGTIDDLAYRMMEKYNKEEVIVYNTLQMYVADKLENLKKAYREAVKGNYYLGVKLVRGAYLEKERNRAKEKGYPDPMQPDKASTDRDFNAALEFCMEKRQRIALCAGTHNELSSYYLTLLMEKYGVAKNDPNVFFAQLYGMSDNISYNLAAAGYNVAKYVPYGPVKAVLPYLFRRAAENTSIAGQSSREFLLIKKEVARRKKRV
jgi:proline dehydrogenase